MEFTRTLLLRLISCIVDQKPWKNVGCVRVPRIGRKRSSEVFSYVARASVVEGLVKRVRHNTYRSEGLRQVLALKIRTIHRMIAVVLRYPLSLRSFVYHVGGR